MTKSNNKNPVQVWINQYSKQFDRYNHYVKDNDWRVAENKKEEYEMQVDICNLVLNRLSYFVTKFEAYMEYEFVKKFLDTMLESVNIHLDRSSSYFNDKDWTTIKDKEKKTFEMEFQGIIMSDYNRITDKMTSSGIVTNEAVIELPIHSDKKIPFLMSDMMEREYPEIVTFKNNLSFLDSDREKNLAGSFSVSDSKEMFINMKNPPVYDPKKHYFEQPQYVIDFYNSEFEKIKNGITINGVYIHGLLYWHLNYYQTEIPSAVLKGTNRYNPNMERVVTQPLLRDNEWYFIENYMEAEKRNLGLFMFGSRRFGKELADYEEILTPTGFTKIKDLKVGEHVFDRLGVIQTVVGVYPQGKKDIFRITTGDGRTIDVGIEHQWLVSIEGNTQVVTTEYIIKNLSTKSITIPISKAVDFEEKEFCSSINEMGNLIKTYIEFEYENISLDTVKFSSISQRKEFINTLLNINIQKEKGRKYFLIQKKALADDIAWILRSLGYYCEVYIDTTDEEMFTVDIDFDKNVEAVEIIDVQMVGHHNATCISVTGDEAVFLTKDLIVTHNTVIESSLATWRATTVLNGETVVVGGSDKDLTNLSKNLETALTNVNPAFKLSRNNDDWTKKIEFGLKDKTNARVRYGSIYLINVHEGKGSATEKTAGFTPTCWIVDEAGKFDVKVVYEAALPSFQSSEGWNLVPLLVGTSGNIDLTEAAKEMLTNPEANSILPMNWDRLNNMVELQDNKTWKEKTFGTFIPAQMSFKDGLSKIKTNLQEYLGINSKQLKNIEINVTNWEKAKKVIETDRELKKHNKDSLDKEKMYYPIDPLECFLTKGNNPFCVEDAMMHLEKIEADGDTGKKVDVSRSGTGKGMIMRFSDKDIAKRNFEGGNINAPVIIYQDPPKDIESLDVKYVAGLDPYKHDKSSGDSVGSLIVMKRNVEPDDFADCIVASYASRPDKIEDFFEICEIVCDAYGARVLQENADIGFEQFLRSKHKDTYMLVNGERIVRNHVKSNSVQNNKLGVTPNVKNKQFMLNLVISYCNKYITIGKDVHGNNIEVRGVTRIKDTELLREIIDFDYRKNTDRIIAFGHALLYKYDLDKRNILPDFERDIESNRMMLQKRKELELRNKNPYGSIRFNPYRNRV